MLAPDTDGPEIAVGLKVTVHIVYWYSILVSSYSVAAGWQISHGLLP